MKTEEQLNNEIEELNAAISHAGSYEERKSLYKKVGECKIELLGLRFPNSDSPSQLIKDLVNDDEGKEFIEELAREEVSFSAGGFCFKTEDIHGGGEGDGEEYWVVFSVEKNGNKTYFKIPGYYQSYEGGELEYENFFEVKPFEKTVTDWATV